MQDPVVPWYFWLVADAVVAASALAVSGYGLRRGGPVERFAAGAYAVAWLGSIIWNCLPLVFIRGERRVAACEQAGPASGSRARGVILGG